MNLGIHRAISISLAHELRPCLQPGRSLRGLDVQSVEKEVALTLYFLKDQVLLLMTVNAFGVVLSTVSVTIIKFGV